MPPEKPAYGSPCNGCGLCCQSEICPLGSLVFAGVEAPCPALEQDGERLVCGLVAHPADYAPIRTAVHGVAAMSDAAALGVGTGVGCDARLDHEELAVAPQSFRTAMEKIRRTPAAARRRVLNLWSDPR